MFSIYDSNAAALKVQALIDDPRLREKMGKRARLTAKEKLDVNMCADLHASVYMEVANGITQ